MCGHCLQNSEKPLIIPYLRIDPLSHEHTVNMDDRLFVCYVMIIHIYIYIYIYAYIHIVVIAYNKSKDQPGKVANPARGQLNGEN